MLDMTTHPRPAQSPLRGVLRFAIGCFLFVSGVLLSAVGPNSAMMLVCYCGYIKLMPAADATVTISLRLPKSVELEMRLPLQQHAGQLSVYVSLQRLANRPQISGRLRDLADLKAGNCVMIVVYEWSS